MDKNTIKAVLEEHRNQLCTLSYEKLKLQEKQDEITKKMQGLEGIVSALDYVEKSTPEAPAPSQATPEVKTEEA